MRLKFSLRKILTVIATFATLANSLSAPALVLAQEASSTPTPSTEATVAPTDNPTTAPDATPAESAVPSPEITAAPTDQPTVAPSETPVVTQAPESNPTTTAPPSIEPTPTLSATPTASPEPQENPSLASTILTTNVFPQTVQDNSWFKLITDKLDYSPTDIVEISGSGFIPNKDYTLEIVSTDPPPVDFTTQVKADGSGNVSYSYQLDGNMRPNYTVYIKIGEEVITSINFTDNYQYNYSHWSDKGSPSWQNGALQSSNSQYFEGEVVSHYWSVTGLTTGHVYGFNIYYDYYTSQSGKNYCGFDYLAQYNTSRTPSFISGSPLSDGAFPEGHGNFYTVGATITNVDSPVISGTERYVQVTFAADSSSAVFYWGLHMATPNSISSCLGAHSWPGASLHTNVDDNPDIPSATNLGGGGTLSLNPSGIIQGTISGYKWNDLNNNGIYDSEPKLSGWTINLCSDSTCTNILQTTTTDASGNYSFSVTPGSYYVGEVQQSGWTKTTPTGSTYGPLAVSASTPTFTNENFGNHLNPTTGTFTVHKTFTDSHSNSGITINVTGDATASGTTNGSGNAVFTLNPGTYSATAVEPDGYYESGNACTRVSVSAGNNTNCTITDSPILGTITVHKDLVGTNIGDGLNNFCFTLNPNPGNGQICADATTGNAVFTNVPKGDYTATETQKLDAYTQTSTNCDQTMSIVNNGDSKSCTITNTRNTGTIELKKIWSGTAGQTTLNIGNSAGGTSVTSVTTGADGTDPLTTGVKTVNTGAYYVSETGGLTNYTPALDCTDNGQSFTPGVSNSFTVVKDHAYVCTFTNTRNQGTITINKTAQGGDGTFNFTIAGDTPSTPQITTTGGNGTTGKINVDTGDNYTVSETMTSGWDKSGGDCYNGTIKLVAPFTISKGDNVVCTFDNTKAGKITIKKVMIGGTDTFNFTGNPSWLSTSISTDGGEQTFDNITPKTDTAYTITEDSIDGWKLTGLSCSGQDGTNKSSGDLTTGKASFYVDPGDDITCTFTNTKLGSISGYKYEAGNTNPLVGWIISLYQEGITNPYAQQTTTVLGFNFTDLLPGNYSLSETQQTGWKAVSSPSDVSLTAGQNSTENNFVNEKNPFKFMVSKVVCDSPQYLPTWTGNVTVTSNTAQEWIDQSNGHCAMNDDWTFQWSHQAPPNGYDRGAYDTPWTSFTAGAEVPVYDNIDNINIREVISSRDYIGFGGTDSARLICSNNANTNDNWEQIVDATYGGYQYCVAFNALNTSSLTIHKQDQNGDPMEGVSISISGSVNDTLSTDASGNATFTGIPMGDYTVSEPDVTNYHLSDVSGDCTWNIGSIDVNVPLIGASCTLVNSRNQGGLKVYKMVDSGDGYAQDSALFTWGIDPNKTTNVMGQSVTLDTGAYNVYESSVQGYGFAGWFPGYPVENRYSCDELPDSQIYTTLPTNVDVNYDDLTTITLCNKILPVPNISIAKTNNAGSGINAGSTVTYILTVSSANGNAGFNNVEVTDYLPGGFTYVAGSTTGATTSDPTINSSKLTWNIGSLSANSTVSISYQVKTDSSLSDGDYLNYATCTANYFEESRKECDPASSTVKIGHGLNYGGNLVGQVLGASTELPATGNPTELLIVSLAILGLGIFLNGYTMKKQKEALKKAAKKTAKRKVKRHAKK